MPLSVIINTKNAAATVRRTLESVSFADQIVIVDMHSQDETVAIAQEFTDEIHQYEDVGYVEPARNFALEQAAHEWILVIDADEELPPKLQTVIKNIVTETDQSTLPDCFYLPRKNIIFGRWIQKTGWWPDYVLRLFRNGYIEWSEELHAVPITRGEVKEIPAQEELALIHHNYQSVSQFVSRLNRYTSIQAKQLSHPESIDSPAIIRQFSSELLRRLFAQRGIKEGVHGVSLSLLQSMSEAVTLMKVWEQQGFFPTVADEAEIIQALYQFERELKYWLADLQVQSTHGLRRWYWRLRRKLMW